MTKLAPPPFVLASASPRRKQLLGQIGVRIARITPANIDETQAPCEKPTAMVARLARQKAQAIHQEGQFTLSADTIVTLGRRVLDKTDSEVEARAHLTSLSGRPHQVVTAICVVAPNGHLVERTVPSRVDFKRLDSWEIDAYIASNEWQGKAGGYAIQGLGGAFVKKISGSYSAIVGLPLYETRNALIGLGYPIHALGPDQALEPNQALENV